MGHLEALHAAVLLWGLQRLACISADGKQMIEIRGLFVLVLTRSAM